MRANATDTSASELAELEPVCDALALDDPVNFYCGFAAGGVESVSHHAACRSKFVGPLSAAVANPGSILILRDVTGRGSYARNDARFH